MRNHGSVIFFILFHLILLNSSAQVKIIFDTDLGGDADDLGTLAMLHNFVSAGECELLGVMCWSTEEYTVAAVDAVNRFYGHPDIPVAIRSRESFRSDDNYCKSVADAFPHRLTNDDVPLAVEAYRKILSQQEDRSVVIVAVGPLKNIQDLIRSGADEYSDLSGAELIEKKIREFVVMGGKFPSGEGEWNFNGNMENVTRFVFDELKAPVVFSGFEIGIQIKTGQVFNYIKEDTPLTAGLLYFSGHAPWMKDAFKGDILDNSTFDQTAVLYAVRGGLGRYWDKVEGGYCEIDPNGDNRWVPGPKTNQSYLVLKEDPEVMAGLIESLMLGNK